MGTLGPRGQLLWDELSEARPFNAAERVLLEELCRMADRLESLDAVLSGEVETWCRIEAKYSGRDREIEVTVDESLSEARQLAATFERLAASLKLPGAKAKEETGGINDLARRRAARHAG